MRRGGWMGGRGWDGAGAGFAQGAGGELAFQLLLGAGDGVALVVEELLDAPDDLELFLAVDALPRAALARAQRRKLGLPVAQDVRLDAERFTGLADLVVEALLNAGLGRHLRLRG
jgi:hypothetical protein